MLDLKRFLYEDEFVSYVNNNYKGKNFIEDSGNYIMNNASQILDIAISIFRKTRTVNEDRVNAFKLYAFVAWNLKGRNSDRYLYRYDASTPQDFVKKEMMINFCKFIDEDGKGFIAAIEEYTGKPISAIDISTIDFNHTRPLDK